MVAERALTELERPFVYARITQKGMERTKSVYEHRWHLNTSNFRIEFVNFGNTPAELTRLQYEIIPRKRDIGIVDSFSPRDVGGRELPVGSVSAKDSPYGENSDLSESQLIQGHADAIANGEESVWVTGFVRYRDIFGMNRITGFTFLFNQDTQWEFIGRGDNENYNYTREEHPEDIPPPSSRG